MRRPNLRQKIHEHRQLLYWLGPVLIVLLIIVSVLGYNHLFRPALPSVRTATDIPRLLVQDLALLRQTTSQLDTSLDSTVSSPKATTKQFLSQLDRMLSTCARISHYRQESKQFTIETQLATILEQADGLCKDTTRVARYSKSQYQTLMPFLSVSYAVRRYEFLPPFSYFKAKNFKHTLETGTLQFKKFTPDPELDFGSSYSITSTLEQAASKQSASNDLSVLATSLREAQSQVLAQRISYWRSYVGISIMQKAQTNQIENTCAHIGPVSYSSIGACLRK